MVTENSVKRKNPGTVILSITNRMEKELKYKLDFNYVHWPSPGDEGKE